MSTTASHPHRHRIAQISAAGAAAGALALIVAIGPTSVWSNVFGDTETHAPAQAPAQPPAQAPALPPALPPAVGKTHVMGHPCFRVPLGGMPEFGGVPMCPFVVPR